ncbi:hypothetical protein VC83_07629 [Pseudogymnoascus destructans]|uniref:ADF-H domain-containing protein n=2 Tax=Pseudogymnoascus destructans TaxID=655981 RepID=L8G142_PSED2|nr:uncharacterized protein VC83_07629 [Pseudogymnoascus destructans]ELR05646.1 hypothetical protein GMDG_01836 [Pseudogymnoascus destructans 20631-21]OAF55622.1 hypothetical protein VC83_07629 [Pseudogymnoascus destructans]
MSLNGLDDLKVKEAHDAAIAEPGGWFLLKYVTRDEIDVLGRGNNGIVEVRNAIASYEEPSPLFGFLKYRRRNVLIKYVPEGSSRLIQARVTVHFNAITDRFSPYDTSFSIDTAKGLKDSALSAACSLHTASGSTSSSTSSLRRRRLMEIAEDEEEDRQQSTVMEERASTIRASSIDGDSDSTEDESPSTEPPELLTSMTYKPQDSETTPEQDSESLDLTPSISADPSVQSSVDHLSESPRQSLDEGRSSMQEGPSDFRNYSSYPAPGRPKIKLGPRPSLDTAGRPQTSSSANYRPVSTLPANVKLFSRSSKRPKERPQSQHPGVNPTMMISPPQLGDPTTNPNDQVVRPYTSGGRPTTSSGASFTSTMSTNTVTSKLPTMTPEKARLMKAMELRKKKKNALRQEHLVSLPADAVTEAEKTVEPAVEPTLAAEPVPVAEPGPIVEPTPSAQAAPTVAEELTEEETTPTLPNDTKEEPENPLAASTTSATESDATANGSDPATPLTVSEPAESTRASSVSDSTDETIQASTANKEVAAVEDISQSDPTSPDNGHESGHVEQSLPQPLIGIDNAVAVPEKEIIAEAQETPVIIPDTPKAQEQEVPTVVVPDVLEEAPVVEEAPVKSDLPTEQTESTTSTVADSQPEPETKELAPEVQVREDKSPSAFITDIATEVSPMPVQVDQNEEAEAKVVVSVDPGDESLPEVKAPMKIPRSKFSSQSLAEPESNNGSGAAKSNGQEGAPRSESPKRRLALMEPIRTDLQMSRPNSEVDFLNNEAFMDELQSATVQEAKPISVAKSPMTPAFPRDAKKGPGVSDRFSRAFSNPSKKDNQHLTPQQLEPTRSVSAGSAYLNRISQQSSSSPVIKKVNVGSGISQRIKALEKLSSTTGTPVAPQGTGPVVGAAPTFFAVRKSQSAGGSKSPSIAERANSLTRQSPSQLMSHDSSPEQFKNRDRSYSIKNTTDAFNSSPTNTHTRARPESISVTARIIRDPNHPYSGKSDMPSDYTTLSLKQSPLVIDHQKFKPAPVQLPMKESIDNKELPTTPAKKERRSSITVVKELISETRNSFAERRKSMTIEPGIISSAMSMRSPSRPSSTHQGSSGRPLSISSRRSSREFGNVMLPTSSILSLSTSEENTEKKASRTSRMLHRMSSSFSSSRKTLSHAMSPTVREESEPPATGVSMSPSNYSSMSGPATTMVEMGDINVQFPDNLLWKRRAMRLDSQGFLILTQSQAGKSTDKAAGVKKYHLSDFRTPAIPDMEAEELPNSVVLDFVDGSGLQFACEDRGGQVGVLQKLLEAHSTWVAYGQ